VTRIAAATRATLDGEPLRPVDGAVLAPIVRDGKTHRLEVALGEDVGPRYRPR